MAGYSASPIDLTLEDEALSERMANMVLESPQSSQVFQHHAGVIPLDQPHTPPDPYRSPFVVNNLLPLPFMNGAYPPPFLQQQQSEQSHVPANPIINPNLLPPQPTSQALYSQQKPVEPAPHQVVDLTSRSPSLEPQVRSLPPELPPKTSVCIGQLSAAALILYPVNYLNPDGEQSVGSEKEWAPVRLSYKHGLSGASGGGTINIGTPTSRGTLGEQLGGEDFGVVEQKVVNVVGPMLGKGMVRLEAKIRKGLPNLPILPLLLLVYTPKGNIAVISQYLQQHDLLLDHPTLLSDQIRLRSEHYLNPHNPPPGGFRGTDQLS